jgi:uncharacterized Fe-S cluster-containing protein
MSEVTKLLGNSVYRIYKKTIYYEIQIILEHKKDFIQFDTPDVDKKIRISEICDFLYLEKDMENYNKMNNILKILQIRENIHSI